jgi:type VI secretion system secreted protein VgrG
MNDVIQEALLKPVRYEFICPDGPPSEFRVYRMHFIERLSEPYELTLELVTDDLASETDQLLGAAAQLDITRNEQVRTVYGIIADVDYIGRSEDTLLVRVRIVPAFGLLAQSVNTRMFQDASVLDILKEVLEPALGVYGRTFDPGPGSRGSTPRDYCMQYHESDFDFAMRLMEEEGISYYFKHGDEGHEVLQLLHENDECPEALNVDGTPVIPIIATRPETADLESLQAVDWLKTLRPTAVRRLDYDFLTPMAPIVAPVDGADDRGYERRLYHHMRRRFVSDDVAARAQDHLEAAKMTGKVLRGRSNVTGFSPGLTFDLDRHSLDELEARFVVTEIAHRGSAPEEILSTGGTGEDDDDLHHAEPRYDNSFQAVPFDVPLRPRHTRRKPKIFGPQTGIVAGPSGEEIHVDEHGRIKVQFHWEEEPTHDDTSSCWIRVAQSWAGPGWGHQFIPRIGMEVVVEFLEGNPDRPLVTGCVYNGDNAYPYPLPGSKTQSGIKTNSSLGGGGSNELRFEDAAGGEEVYIHAQKDMNTMVENNQSNTVGNDQTVTIGHDRTKKIGNDQSEEVGNDKKIKVKNDHTENVDGHYSTTIKKNETHTVIGNQTLSVTGTQDVSVTGAVTEMFKKTKKETVVLKSDEFVGAMKTVKVVGLYSESVLASRSITAVGAMSFTAGLSAKFQSAKGVTIKAQKNLTSDADVDQIIKSGKKMNITAGDNLVMVCKKKGTINCADQLTIHVGSAKVILKKNGDITVEGKKINVKGSGAVTIKGSKITLN